MPNNSNQIGKNIINNENGIGEIIEIVQMGDNEDFYRVFFKNSEATNFYSVNNQKNYRMLASSNLIKEAIEVFKQEHALEVFKSVQDRIKFYQKALKESDIKVLAKHLSILNSQDEIHTGLKTKFEKALKTLVLEISYVLEIKNIEALKLLGLNKNNK